MKKVYTMIKGAGLLTAAALVLSGCSGKGGEEWGVDQSVIPQCNSDRDDASAAILVPPGTAIRAAESGTTVRVWHYSNSDELVCVLTGAALLTREG